MKLKRLRDSEECHMILYFVPAYSQHAFDRPQCSGEVLNPYSDIVSPLSFPSTLPLTPTHLNHHRHSSSFNSKSCRPPRLITQPSTTMSTEERAALSTVQKFLSSIKSRDPASMHSCVLPDSHALLIRPKTHTDVVEPTPTQSKPQTQPEKQHLHLTLAEVIDRLPFSSPKSMEENIALASWESGSDGDLYEGCKTEVKVDHDLAVVWTPYEVRIDGVQHHVGTNIWSLVKMEDRGWVIVWISDTYRSV